MSTTDKIDSSDPIAIIGIGCRFPGGVTTPQEFWQLLRAGTDTIAEIPSERWDHQRYYHPDPTKPGKYYCPRAALLSQVDQFDASFFGIAPPEASRMDPQQRLLLEICWEALEDGGQLPSQLAGSSTGVFIGVASGDYGMGQIQDVSSINGYTNAGITPSIASNRISYLFDFHGPSYTVDTACSSSLVALHLACQSLQQGECELALAGGVSILLEPAINIGLSKASMLSPTGQCRAFDAEANGYVRGEGAGIVALKPFSRAMRDGDPVYAVILATDTKQDGHTPSLHQPSRWAQEELLQHVYAKAGIAPTQVAYVEAHGTGTTVGDFIEGHALGTVLGQHRSEGEWLHIGSVKTQIGHLEAAAGIAGLIKAALILKYREVPASLHFHAPNPQIPFEKLHLKVQQELEALPVSTEPPVVGVNSFGFGGTNAHAVLQAIPRQKELPLLSSHSSLSLLPISARSQEALHELVQAYLDLLSTSTQELPSLRDLCFTTSVRRDHHAYRLAVLADSHSEMASQLETFLAEHAHADMLHKQPSKASGIAFVFCGNGPQWWAMGRQLLTENTLFRKTVEQCDRLLTPYTGWSLLDKLSVDEAQSQMHRTDVAQPTLFALQVGLSAVWKAWGIEPDVVIGHSVGEIAASYVAGILSLEEAIKVVYHRSRLQEVTAGMGKMVAVSLSEQEALMLLSDFPGQVTLASINSPSSVTLTGNAKALEQIVEMLEQRGIFARLLPLNYAFHSPCLDPIRDELLTSLRDIYPRAASIPFISTVTGHTLAGTECDATYWWENLRLPVQFLKGIEQLLEVFDPIFLEIGPHPVLTHYLSECLQLAQRENICLPSLHRKEHDQSRLLKTLAVLYTNGYSIRWKTLTKEGCYVSLPLYPWQREHHWNTPRYSGLVPREGLGHPLLGSRLLTAPALWESSLDQETLDLLSEHRVHHTTLVPLAGYAEIALALAKEISGKEIALLEDLQVHRPLILHDANPSTIQTHLSLEDHTFEIASRSHNEQTEWTLHMSGRIGTRGSTSSSLSFQASQFRQRCRQEISGEDFYQKWAPQGLQYGSRFQCIERVYIGEGEAQTVIRSPEITQASYAQLVLLDNCAQIMFALVPPTCLPTGIDRLYIYREPSTPYLYCSAKLVKAFPNAFQIDVAVVDEHGQPVLEMHKLRVQTASFLQSGHREATWNCLYEALWVSSPTQLLVQATSSEAARCWVLFTDTSGVAAQLANRITARGEIAVLVEKGAAYQQRADHHFILCPGSAEDMQLFLKTLHTQNLQNLQMIYLWGIDPLADQITSVSLQSAITMSCFGLVTLVQQLMKLDWQPLPNLWVITGGAQVLSEAEIPTIEQAPLYGLSRVLHHEHPELHCTLIDIGVPHEKHSYNPEVLQALYEEMQSPADESEVLLHGSTRYVHRIRRVSLERTLTASEVAQRSDLAFRLISTSHSSLDDLILQTIPRLSPSAGEVEIEVQATGLNFKDVMLAMGLISSEAMEGGYADISSLGQDCAGRITALGEGVTDFQIGDEVIAIGRYCVGSFVTTNAALVIHKPASMSFEEGATIPLVFATAYYALHHLAKLRKGERVLIHAATGGVGLAALQIVRAAGGEVFATAGSEEKRAYLRSLGVQHVFDSRSLAFADDILQVTHGEGVDVVLNSLAGEAASKGLEVLRPFGRFLELGIRDLLKNKKEGLRPFQRCLSYFAIDLNQLLRHDVALMREILHDVASLFEQGTYRPLPYCLYSLSQVKEAFRSLQQTHHIGKIVIGFQESDAQISHQPFEQPFLFRTDASYLVIGGLSGFGLATAQWMAQRGVQHLALAGLSGRPSKEATEKIESMRAAGVNILTIQVDVTQEEQVASLFEKLHTNLPPLRGVVHAAASFEDRALLETDQATLTKVMAPKVLGAWNLHRQACTIPLDFFLLYSSMAALIGNNSQGSYVAGNMFLDALALMRCAQGLPAIAVEWGVLAQVGVVAQNRELSDVLKRKGLNAMTPQQYLEMLEKVLQTERSLIGVGNVDWHRLDAFLFTAASRSGFLELLSEEQEESSGHLGEMQAATPEEQLEHVQTRLREILARLLGKPASAFDLQSTADLSLDSLLAMELRHTLRRELGVDISVMQLLRVQSVTSMVTMLTELMIAKA